MSTTHVATATQMISADKETVWDALTNPAIIKKYFFNTDVETDWQVGSPIYWRGEWEGKKYEDKGTILEVKPNKFLKMNHWSPLTGTPDTPENYHNVMFTLQPQGEKTELTIEQDNNASEEAQKHSEKNWKMMLESLEKVLTAK